VGAVGAHGGDGYAALRPFLAYFDVVPHGVASFVSLGQVDGDRQVLVESGSCGA
jgi:hypothetical protein